MAGALGMAILFVIMKLDYHVYQKPAFVFSVLSLVVGLCVVCVLPACDKKHASLDSASRAFRFSRPRWPSSRWSHSSRTSSRSARAGSTRFRRSFPIGVIVAMLAGLIVLQKDLGTALALLVTAAVLLYVAGLNMKWIGVSALAALPIGYIAFYFLVFLVPYRWNRILAYLEP